MYVLCFGVLVFCFWFFLIVFEFPTELLNSATLLNEVYEFEHILKDVSSECDKRRDYLSRKHGIPRDRIDLKKNIGDVNFHLRGLQSLGSMFPSFVRTLGGPGRVVGILGPRGISKTSTALSLAHKDTKKEYQRYIIYATANGVVQDGNMAALTTDIGHHARPIAQSEWGKPHSRDKIKQNLEECYQISQYFVNCDALARVLLLRLLIDKGNDLLTPHFHQQLQFSKQGDSFIAALYYYLKSFNRDSIRLQLDDNLAYVVNKLDDKVFSVLDEALYAVSRFDYLISLTAISTEFNSLYDYVTGKTAGEFTGSAGNPRVANIDVRGFLLNVYQ